MDKRKVVFREITKEGNVMTAFEESVKAEVDKHMARTMEIEEAELAYLDKEKKKNYGLEEVNAEAWLLASREMADDLGETIAFLNSGVPFN